MRRIRAALAHGTRTSALVLLFAGSTVLGVALHANLPATRRLASRIANDATSSAFAGRLLVEDVRELHLLGGARVRAGSVRILDPEGRLVLVGRDVDAEIRLGALLESLAKGGAPVIRLTDATVNDAEVVLDVDEKGSLGIERALAPPKAHAPTPATPLSGAPTEELVLDIPHAFVRHAWVHGNLVPPALDADADDVRAHLGIEHNVFKMDVEKARVTLRSPRAPGQALPLTGAGNIELTIPLETGELAGKAVLHGDIGGVPIAATASLDRGEVDAAVEIENAPPAAIARAFPALQTRDPVSVRATAVGKLPELRLHAEARSGASKAIADGSYDFRAGHPFTVDVQATRIDGSGFGGVATDVSGTVHIEGAVTEKGAVGRFAGTTERGTVAGQVVPPLVVEGRFESSLVTSTVRAEEPGVRATAKLVLDVPKKEMTFDAQARSDDLRRLARAPDVVSGSGSARARGRIDLEGGTITARVEADTQNLSSGAFSTGSARAEGTLTGPLAAPVADVSFDARTVRITAPGKTPLEHPHATGSAKIAFAPAPRVVDAEVKIGDGVHARAERVDLGPEGVVVRGARVTGLGAPIEADVTTSPSGWRIRIKADDIDVHRAAALTGIGELRQLPQGTRASLDVDLASDGDGARGHADVSLKGEGTRGELHARVDGRRLTGSARAEIPGAAYVEANAVDVDIPDARKPLRASGALEVRGAIDLAQGAAMFGGERFERIGGILYLEGRVERTDVDGPLHARASARTKDLDAVLADGTTIAGVDGSAHVDFDGRTEDLTIAATTWDANGLVASADAKTKIPFDAWTSGKSRFDANALAALEVHGRADLAQRDVATLPLGFARQGTRGTIAAQGTLEGTLGHPRALVHAVARNVKDTTTRDTRRAGPMDGVLDVRWDGEDATAVLGIDERRARDGEPSQVRALAIGKVRAADVVRVPFGARLPWQGSAEIYASDFDIAPLPLPHQLEGSVTGRARIRDLGGAPSFEAQATIADFGNRDTKVETTEVSLGGRDGSLFLSVRAKDKNGAASLQVASQGLRVKGLDVSLDDKAPTRLDYDVHGLRLALVRPLVRRALPELDGRVDGRGSVVVDGSSQVFEGGLSVTEGKVYIASVGEDVTHIAATARFEKSGAFKIEHATGKSGSGEFTLSADGAMDGFRFRQAAGIVKIDSKEGIPLSSEGATFAEATGEVQFEARMSEKRDAVLLTLTIPRANIEIPRRDAQALQGLDPDPTIAVGLRRGGKLEPAPRRRERRGESDDEILPTKVTVVLGDDVIAEGRGMSVGLGGKALVDIAQEVAVTGRIDLRSGTIEVHGRRFVVDRGTITWPPGSAPSNPTIVAAAYWDAPDKTRIWVEFTGPFKTGTLTLRSEPPYSKNEILSILLFGRPDPNMATAGVRPAGSSQAAAVGTGFVASDVNSVLSQIDENLDYETDTLSGNRTRTKVGYRLRRNLRVQIGYAPGRSYREPDTTFLFLDWQFVPKWSVVATRGDRGTSILDVLFQHRY